MTDKELDDWSNALKRYIRAFIDNKVDENTRRFFPHYVPDYGIAIICGRDFSTHFPSFDVWRAYDNPYQEALARVKQKLKEVTKDAPGINGSTFELKFDRPHWGWNSDGSIKT